MAGGIEEDRGRAEVRAAMALVRRTLRPAAGLFGLLKRVGQPANDVAPLAGLIDPTDGFGTLAILLRPRSAARQDQAPRRPLPLESAGRAEPRPGQPSDARGRSPARGSTADLSQVPAPSAASPSAAAPSALRSEPAGRAAREDSVSGLRAQRREQAPSGLLARREPRTLKDIAAERLVRRQERAAAADADAGRRAADPGAAAAAPASRFQTDTRQAAAPAHPLVALAARSAAGRGRETAPGTGPAPSRPASAGSVPLEGRPAAAFFPASIGALRSGSDPTGSAAPVLPRPEAPAPRHAARSVAIDPAQTGTANLPRSAGARPRPNRPPLPDDADALSEAAWRNGVEAP